VELLDEELSCAFTFSFPPLKKLEKINKKLRRA
jgi:hypothetical protein